MASEDSSLDATRQSDRVDQDDLESAAVTAVVRDDPRAASGQEEGDRQQNELVSGIVGKGDANAVPSMLNGDSEEGKSLPATCMDALPDASMADGEVQAHNLSKRDAEQAVDVNGDASIIEAYVHHNQAMVNEIDSCRTAIHAMEEKRELLETDLQRSKAGIDAVHEDIAKLQEQRRNAGVDLAAALREVDAFKAENISLQEDNQKVFADKMALDSRLVESLQSLNSLVNDFNQVREVASASQTKLHLLCFEVEKLKLQKEEYLQEISLLGTKSAETVAQVAELQEDEKALGKEIAKLMAASCMAEEKAFENKRVIVGLKDSMAEAEELDSNLESQLYGTKSRIQNLHEEDNVMVARRKDLETRLACLQEELQSRRSNHQNDLVAFEEAKAANASLTRSLEITQSSINTFERDLEAVKSSFSMQEADVNMSQQRLQELESQVSKLQVEKQALETGNYELDDIVKRLKSDAQMLEHLREKAKNLELAVDNEKENIKLSSEREIKLKSKLQKLNISGLKKHSRLTMGTSHVLLSTTIAVIGLVGILLHPKARQVVYSYTRRHMF